MVGKKNFNTGVVRVGVQGRKRGDRSRREGQVRVDKSEDTTTSVMSTGGNMVLSDECPIRAEGRITRYLKLLGCRKMGFLEKNEVILLVARKKGA